MLQKLVLIIIYNSRCLCLRCSQALSVEYIDTYLIQEKYEPFIDVNELAIVSKQIRPICEQDENESRRLWKEVTKGLKFNDIDKASNAKYEIEERQRQEAKERKNNNLDWETKASQHIKFVILLMTEYYSFSLMSNYNFPGLKNYVIR